MTTFTLAFFQSGRAKKCAAWQLLSWLLLVSLSYSAVQAQSFVHPGLLHTQQDFTRMQVKVAANEQPWKGSWDILVANSHSSLTRAFTNPAPSIVYRGADGVHPENYASLFRDAASAYATALRWKVSGDAAYAEKSIAILNSWSANLTAIQGTSDRYLASGIYGYQLANAAEIMRTYSGWAPTDFARCKTMLLSVFYSMNHDFLLNHNGTCISHYWANWDLANMASMISIGVLCDRRDIYDEAVNYFKFGAGNGAIDKLVPYLYGDLGQWQESGRDQGHTVLGVALAGSFAEMAWNQGDDLYGYDNNRLLKGFEHTAKYNLGYEVPYTTYRNCDGIVQTVISADARGNVRPVWEIAYNHYVNRKGLSAPYTALFAQRVRPEGGGGNYGPNSGGYDQLGYGSLTFALEEPSRPNTQTITFPALLPQAFGAPDFSPGATASSGLPVVYSVLDPTIVSVTASGQLRVLRPGTTTVYAQQLGNSTVSAAPVAAQSITVNQVPGTTDGTWINQAGTVTAAISSTSGSANLTWAGQTFVVGEHLKLNAPVPGGFTAGIIYSVVAVSNGGSTFQLALRPGGTSITATTSITNGVGQRMQKWAVPANWNGGVLPSGPNATATFGATSFANVPGVQLDGNVTIGNLVYAANGTSELVLASGLNNGQLTFATAAGTPTLTMINSGTRKLFMGWTNGNARMPLRFAGTQGLNISTPILGGSTYAGLRIQAAMDWSNFSGTLSLLQGTIELHNTTNSPTGADNVLLPMQRLNLGATATAVVAFSGNSSAAQTQTIGALDGTSDAFILAKTSLTNGAPTLIVGADNEDGSYDGVIGMGPIGAPGDQGRLNFEKVGTGTQVISGIIKNGVTGTASSAVTVRNGTLVLANDNEYLGGTTVVGGTLEVNGAVVSSVAVQAGTISGTGHSAAAVAIGTGTGAGATLAPGSAGIGTFSTTGPVSLLTDATYALEVNSATTTADKLVAGGLTLTDARLVVAEVSTGASLPAETSFVIIDNTGAAPVTGTFLNLPEGSTLTAGSTLFRISYVGGTGNDVTLMVISGQTIDFAAIGDQSYGAGPLPVALTATATSGLPVSYALLSGPATLSGSTLTVTGLGTVTVQASQPGSPGYLAAPSVTQSFEVRDVTAPTVATQPNLRVTLDDTGQASITAAQVDNGSSDNYTAPGNLQFSLDNTSFNCSNIGPNTVTLTVTDESGNSATGTAVVTVVGSVPAAAIAVAPASVVVGGMPTIYLGYGPPTATLTATGGTSYRWSPAAGLSNANSANPVFAPALEGSYTYTVEVTNEYGCTSTASVTVKVEDVRCGNGSNKVQVCHRGTVLCVAASAINAHLGHGDQLGSCTPAAARGAGQVMAAGNAALQLASVFEAYPNPFSESTTIHFQALQASKAQVQVYNSLGRLVATLYDGPVQAGHDYQLPLTRQHLAAGLYTCRLLLGDQVYTQRVVLAE